MEIMFDPAKRAATLADRGLDFAEAPKVFAGPTFTFADLRFDYPEERFVTIGLLEGRMVQVVWTPASNGRRIISMRKTNDWGASPNWAATWRRWTGRPRGGEMIHGARWHSMRTPTTGSRGWACRLAARAHAEVT